ncbi:MAG: methyltransferase [Bacteroidia bacterium]|nr:methyltransferase [Bacteroidia bacterium]
MNKTGTQIHTPESIREMVNNYQKSRVILSAVELDIFSEIGKKAKTSEQIATALKTNRRATDRFLNTLCGLGFLIKKNHTFQNTDFALTYLCKTSPDYMYGLMHSVNQWDTWSTLTDAVTKGTTVVKRPKTINNRSSKWLDAFIGAMHYRAYKSAPGIVALLDISGVKKVLDVGGGSGAYSMGFIKSKKGITATVFDLPNVVPITKKFVAKEKFQKQINIYRGDYLTDELPKGFDLVFLSAIIHINTLKENEKLIKKCAHSLNPGGMIVIQDYIMENDRVQPPSGALFALNMLVGTIAGDTYTEGEVKSWFKKAGIKFEKKIPVHMGNSLMIGLMEK